MKEIQLHCPICENERDKRVEMDWIEWSAFDLGTAICKECGYKIDYNKERSNDRNRAER